MKLNQLVAVEKGVRAREVEKLTSVYKAFQRVDSFGGLVRKYQPLGDDASTPSGETLPNEQKNIQERVEDLVSQLKESASEIANVTYQRDVTNTVAKADVVVGGQVIVKGAPVPYLLSLEKQLNDLHSEVKKIPTLDPSERWTKDSQLGVYVSETTETARTKKVSGVLTLSPATDKHPAQVKEITEDVRVGTWRTTKHSAAIPAAEKAKYLANVEALQKAVKYAREEANNAEVVQTDLPGRSILDFIFTP